MLVPYLWCNCSYNKLATVVWFNYNFVVTKSIWYGKHNLFCVQYTYLRDGQGSVLMQISQIRNKCFIMVVKVTTIFRGRSRIWNTGALNLTLVFQLEGEAGADKCLKYGRLCMILPLKVDCGPCHPWICPWYWIYEVNITNSAKSKSCLMSKCNTRLK